MTLSLSLFGRRFVMKEFFSSLKSFNGVLGEFKRCFKEVSRMLFQESVMAVFWKIDRCFKGI